MDFFDDSETDSTSESHKVKLLGVPPSFSTDIILPQIASDTTTKTLAKFSSRAVTVSKLSQKEAATAFRQGRIKQAMLSSQTPVRKPISKREHSHSSAISTKTIKRTYAETQAKILKKQSSSITSETQDGLTSEQFSPTLKLDEHIKTRLSESCLTLADSPPGVILPNISDPAICYAPKRLSHVWSHAHAKGVKKVRWMPRSGHLFASSGFLGHLKLWDTATLAGTRAMAPLSECSTTRGHHASSKYRMALDIAAHEGSLQDFCFSPEGRTIFTVGADKTGRLWDLETLQCSRTIQFRGLPQRCLMTPGAKGRSAQTLVSVGRRIMSYDMRVKEPTSSKSSLTQIYADHLAPVHSLLSLPGGRFVTASEDRTLRIWEQGMPLPVKRVAEAQQHSTPSLALHPIRKHFAAQGLDNIILILLANKPFTKLDSRRFKGHDLSGFACELSFSPDGQYLSSGTGDGSLHLWDWDTRRTVKVLKDVHQGCLSTHDWHPCATSKVLTAGWDGNIKLWD
eukprot:gnl/Dysnectes_brevis/5061_a7117_667.p1 GENE.gnl/Dysnectes_brevis/5061_a7117_667~~gnl/Dysnectes_brevis/5061_a7117_667.p1  ORF type:complete len:511 (-),score=49.04 gnl/Dysnectes_brevis/5061_a7117_667:18-1550(-)